MKLVKHLKPAINLTLTALTVAFLLTLPAAHADLLFVSKVMGPIANIYSVNESGQLTKITDNILWRDMEPDIATNATVAFMSNREENTKIDMRKRSENFNIFLHHSQDNRIQQITNTTGQELSPKFSPDDSSLAYLRDLQGKRELCVWSIKDKRETVVVAAERIFGYSWSPDSQKIAYAAKQNKQSTLSTIDLASSKTEVLYTFSKKTIGDRNKDTNNQAQEIVSPQWSPDGKKIAFISHPLFHGAERKLMAFNLSTKTTHVVSSQGAQVQEPINWSRDSQRLLYSALVGYKFYYDDKSHKKVYRGGMHIFLSTLGGNTTQLTQGDHLFKKPVFSPDEKRIGFLYADTLASRTLILKTMKLDGQDEKVLHSSVAQQSSLIWY